MKTHHPPPHGFDRFLSRARDFHGERFLYDRSSWIDFDHHVKIFCSAHGWFKQIAKNHTRPASLGGCAECNKLDGFLSFVSKAKAKHGDRFEYSMDASSSSNRYIKVYCARHGWFSQAPSDHLRHSGCFSCATENKEAKLKTEDVLNDFRATHGDSYSYEKVVYRGASVPVTITCKIHGDFSLLPGGHKLGYGCKRCSKRHRWTTEEFIANSRAVHGDKFTYDRTCYKQALAPIVVTCRTHGDFNTQPARHVTRKDGCPKCNPKRWKGRDRFIQEARDRFGDKYDYSHVVYVNSRSPVKIICPHHGMFEQLPPWHLNNSVGCPSCSYSVSNKEIAWLDSINLPSTAKRQAKVLLGSRRRNVDAFDPATNTVYEFWGDWWHGHPDYFPPKAIHPIAKVAYADLYRKTMEKRQLILKSGYTLVEIWEHDYDAQVSSGQMAKPAGRLTKRKPIKRARTGIS